MVFVGLYVRYRRSQVRSNPVVPLNTKQVLDGGVVR